MRASTERFAMVVLVNSQRTETPARSMAEVGEHFERMGGIPLLAVFGRPRRR